jgi:hypothetical protein
VWKQQLWLLAPMYAEVRCNNMHVRVATQQKPCVFGLALTSRVAVSAILATTYVTLQTCHQAILVNICFSSTISVRYLACMLLFCHFSMLTCCTASCCLCLQCAMPGVLLAVRKKGLHAVPAWHVLPTTHVYPSRVEHALTLGSTHSALTGMVAGQSV